MASLPILTAWLKAAGEPSRLRLLALCAHREFSVTDLADALRQSEPRVSRHLRILCEAGLLERVRQGQWVHYRLVAEPMAAAFVRGVLAQADRRDPQLADDRQRAERADSPSGAIAASAESRLGRALAAFVGSTVPAETTALSARWRSSATCTSRRSTCARTPRTNAAAVGSGDSR